MQSSGLNHFAVEPSTTFVLPDRSSVFSTWGALVMRNPLQNRADAQSLLGFRCRTTQKSFNSWGAEGLFHSAFFSSSLHVVAALMSFLINLPHSFLA